MLQLLSGHGLLAGFVSAPRQRRELVIIVLVLVLPPRRGRTRCVGWRRRRRRRRRRRVAAVKVEISAIMVDPVNHTVQMSGVGVDIEVLILASTSRRRGNGKALTLFEQHGMEGGDGVGEATAKYRRQLQQLRVLVDVWSPLEVDSCFQVFWHRHRQAAGAELLAHSRLRRNDQLEVAVVVRVWAGELLDLQTVLMQAASRLALSDDSIVHFRYCYCGGGDSFLEIALQMRQQREHTRLGRW